MRLRALLALLVGCGDDPNTPLPELAFDLDIAVSASGAQVWLRDRAEDCQTFPRPGQCVDRIAEASCALKPVCLERVDVERGGVVIGSAELGKARLEIAAALDAGPAELVIEGCGGTHRVALPQASSEVPVLTDLVAGTGSVLGTVTPAAGATSTLASLDGPVNELSCHEPSADAWRVLDDYPGDLALASVAEGPTTDTLWGDAHVWLLARRPPEPIAIPIPAGNDKWHVVIPALSATAKLDGMTTSVALSSWHLVRTPSGILHELQLLAPNALGVIYTAGELSDGFTVTSPQVGVFSGTTAHTAPLDDLEMSVADDGRFSLSVFASVKLIGASTTKSFSLQASWMHPRVARLP